MSFSALTSLDFICILICVISGIIGYKRGAINTLISFGGFIASFVMAWIFSPLMADWLIKSGILNSLFEAINVETITQSLMNLSAQQNSLATSLMEATVISGSQAVLDQGIIAISELIRHGIAQSISFGIIILGGSFLCWILQIIFSGISKIPVIGIINHLAGMLIGLILGGAIIAVMLWVFSVINLSTGGVSNLPTVENSNLLQIGVPTVFNYLEFNRRG